MIDSSGDAVTLESAMQAGWFDVLFDEVGHLALEHHSPGRVYPLARIQVAEDRAEPSLEAEFEELRTNADLTAERERIEVTIVSDA